MTPYQMIRFFHSNRLLWHASQKSLLAELRKKTGYTLTHCKKALEMHENDTEKAEKWLREQAQKHGWAQAAKLRDRTTSQGLIALMIEKNYGALVELNCETDFVARNEKFHNLAGTVATAVYNHATKTSYESEIKKTFLYSDTLLTLPAADGKSLGDHAAITIGNIGENVNIKRAVCMSASSDTSLFGCTHPVPMNPVPLSFGKYGVLVAMKGKDLTPSLGSQICQHIIGMSPMKVGDPKVDEPNQNVEEEACLLYQDFLFNSDFSVQQVLESEQVEVLDFARFEMGEALATDEVISSIETCG